MKEKKFMPEGFCSLDENMSMEKVLRAKEASEPLVAKVLMYHSKDQTFDVDLGNGLYGILPLKSASIYPIYSEGIQLSAALRYIIGRNIIVNVSAIDIFDNSSPIIMLSRVDLMLEHFKLLSYSIGETFECCITAIASFGIFVDLGNGISGLINFKDLCTSRVKNFSDLGFSIGDKVTVKLLEVDNETLQIKLGYKEQFPNLAFALDENDLIIVKVLNQFNEDGYYALANPNTFAVLDVPQNVPFNYGDKVLARVKKQSSSNPSKLRLHFISFV